MLTKEHAIAHYDWQRGVIVPDRLTQTQHAHYLERGAQMLTMYQQGQGKMRKELHKQVRALFADDDFAPTRRIDAFCKLLDDVSEFDQSSRRNAPKLRRRVFRLAAAYHPLVTCSDGIFTSLERDVKRLIADQLNTSWPRIERDLFADVIEFQRLQTFHGYESPAALLARYNVAQVQAALYRATQMTIFAEQDFKVIVQNIKLARLMHTITRLEDGRYRLTLDGPASILRNTRRYGIAMAKFLPSLLGCRDWKLHAKIEIRSGSTLALRLVSGDRVGGALPSPKSYDSEVERSFHEKWGIEARNGWRLRREAEILSRGQRVFLPDFALEHADGRHIHLEIIGFWTPEYLAAKAETLRFFSDVPVLLAIAETNLKSLPPSIQASAIPYKTALKVQDVLAAAERMTTAMPEADHLEGTEVQADAVGPAAPEPDAESPRTS